ncbi:MAG: hypothetical protein IJN34_00810 [Clostridia bacterium]|nr:hypothetical protein [Clostridia bacterium]
MNQNKFWRFLVITLIMGAFLTACTDKSNKDKTSPNAEFSQDQPIDGELDNPVKDKFESNSENSHQSINDEDSVDNVASSNSNATEIDSNADNSAANTKDETPSKQSDPSIDENDRQSDFDPNSELTYEEYMAMTPTEQKAYYDSYENFTDFVAWHNAAKAEYDAENESVEIQDGEINISDIIGITD